MTVEHEEDVTRLQRIGAIVAEARDTMARAVAPGISTLDLDQIGQEVLTRHGARSAPKLAYDFPGWTCISVNDEVAHGIPSASKILSDGDVVNIDVSAELDGYWADSGASYSVGRTAPSVRSLLKATQRALADAMGQVRAGVPIRELGRAVELRARASGYRVIQNLCGHGVGRHIHEAPSIPNCFDEDNPETLWEGLVMTIEPFLSASAELVVEDRDGWTLRTEDGSLAAQYEHTMIVTAGKPIVVT